MEAPNSTSGKKWTPQKAANRLVRVAETFTNAHGLDRFPINVDQLALGAADIFGWSDPITKIQAKNIKHFEGALFPNENKTNWLLLFNQAITSVGRVRFTKAHELGHYILHRMVKDSFECSNYDMLNWSNEKRDIEAQADLFASYLLMPLNDFRSQINSTANLDLISHCADRYGVSLTAAILKWLSYTSEKALLIMSNDGFMNWAWSSEPAYKAGAFFKTRNNVIPVPVGSLAADNTVNHERLGSSIPSHVWFKHADNEESLREMKIFADQYDSIITLLILPKDADVWPPRD